MRENAPFWMFLYMRLDVLDFALRFRLHNDLKPRSWRHPWASLVILASKAAVSDVCVESLTLATQDAL